MSLCAPPLPVLKIHNVSVPSVRAAHSGVKPIPCLLALKTPQIPHTPWRMQAAYRLAYRNEGKVNGHLMASIAQRRRPLESVRGSAFKRVV